MSEPTLAREFRMYFLAKPLRDSGYCPACAQAITTVGPRGGKVFQWPGHLPDCLLKRVYEALCERGD